MRKTIFCFLIIFSPLLLRAQFNENTMSPRGKALGQNAVVLDDFWSAFSNQAALALQKKTTVGFLYNNQFSLSGLNDLLLAAVFPFGKIGSFGGSYGYFGNSLYNEQQFGLAYARNFGKYISGGLQFDYLSSHFGSADYASENLFTFEFGMLFQIMEKLKAGFHIYNPVSIQRNSYQDERVQAIVRVGVLYAFLPELNGVLELEKNIENQERLKFGLEYTLLRSIAIRVGIAGNPTIYTFGIGWNKKHWLFDAAFEVHNVLGISPMLSAAYRF